MSEESKRETITRAELVNVVDTATAGITASTRAKLLAVAESTDAVAVGWFHCDGCLCPASQAGRRNQRFMEGFDRAMAQRFGRVVSESQEFGPAFKPFVVEVRDAA